MSIHGSLSRLWLSVEVTVPPKDTGGIWALCGCLAGGCWHPVGRALPYSAYKALHSRQSADWRLTRLRGVHAAEAVQLLTSLLPKYRCLDRVPVALREGFQNHPHAVHSAF